MKGLALVTGGSRGIGAACCRILAEKDYRPVIHYNHGRDRAEALAQELPGAFVVHGDLSTLAGCEEVFKQVQDLGMPLQVLVNNAGMVKDAPLFSADPSDFDRLMAVNLRAAWYLTKRVVRLFVRNRGGRIINISSVSGSLGNYGQAVYGMTKAGLEQLTRTAALELAEHNILVNAVAPGLVETDMTAEMNSEARAGIVDRIPLRRMGTAREIAEVVGFLAASGSYMTGTVIHVNGGLYAD